MDPHLVQRYGSKDGAAAYRRKYRRSLLRRLSNRRELAVVSRSLAAAGAEGRLLDCPCGAGRLVPVLLRHGTHVTAVDASAAMVDEARDALSGASGSADAVAFAVAPVQALPFPDDQFHTVVCHRLIHHLADAQARAEVLRELARVARTKVVISFNDATTFKHRSQLRRGRRRRRVACTPTELAAEVKAHGLVLEPPVRRLHPLFSLVAVAVLRVEPDGA